MEFEKKKKKLTTAGKLAKEIDAHVSKLVKLRNHPLDEVVPVTKVSMNKVLSEYF